MITDLVEPEEKKKKNLFRDIGHVFGKVAEVETKGWGKIAEVETKGLGKIASVEA